MCAHEICIFPQRNAFSLTTFRGLQIPAHASLSLVAEWPVAHSCSVARRGHRCPARSAIRSQVVALPAAWSAVLLRIGRRRYRAHLAACLVANEGVAQTCQQTLVPTNTPASTGIISGVRWQHGHLQRALRGNLIPEYLCGLSWTGLRAHCRRFCTSAHTHTVLHRSDTCLEAGANRSCGTRFDSVAGRYEPHGSLFAGRSPSNILPMLRGTYADPVCRTHCEHMYWGVWGGCPPHKSSYVKHTE